MHLRFSATPGRWERHLQRSCNNPLFGQAAAAVNREQLARARGRDQEEARQFQQHFESLVHRATSLQPQEDSEAILALKAQLDQAYEQAAGLAGDNQPVQEAIRKLVALIMDAVRRGAVNDPQALSELAQEDSARAQHYRLLQAPLVADLLAPDSPIQADQLLPCLLSARADELDAAIQLFDHPQLTTLLEDAKTLLATTPLQGDWLDSTRRNLHLMTRAASTQAN